MSNLDIQKIIEQSAIPEFKSHCIALLGEKKAELIVQDTYNNLPILIDKTDMKDSKIEQILMVNLLPTLSYYQSLLKHEISQDKAVQMVSDELIIFAQKDQDTIIKSKNLPFFFQFFIISLKKTVKNRYPKDGWKIRWMADNEREAVFKVQRCIYKEVLDIHNANELCYAFCQMDSARFGNLPPTIEFARSETLVNGNSCDFRFIKRN